MSVGNGQAALPSGFALADWKKSLSKPPVCLIYPNPQRRKTVKTDQAKSKREALRRAIERWNATPVIYTEAGPYVRVGKRFLPVAIKRLPENRRVSGSPRKRGTP